MRSVPPRARARSHHHSRGVMLMFKLLTAGISVCFCFLSFFATASTQSPPTQSISELSWISGDWQTPAGGKVQIDEHWSKPAGGSMIGMSRSVSGDRTVEFEYLRIEQRADGIFYVAHPEARCPGTDFKLTRASSNEVVFENAEHDFPKRIMYRKTSDDAITASIDAGEGTKAMSFSYRKAK